MDGLEIFYFSGTGNSFAVARCIAEKLKADLVPVTSKMKQESIEVKADAIGLVFPIYDFKPPPIFEDFICKLRNIDSKYLFAVCTYGIAVADSLKHLEKVVQSCGGQLSGGFAVSMPHNGIGSSGISQTERDRLLGNWRGKVGEICEYVSDRAEGKIESSNLLFAFLRPEIIRMMPSLFKFLVQVLTKGLDSLAFTLSEACNGCGVCERVCPVNNIDIADNRPVWSNHCAGCFACLHWCPEKAISLGGLSIRPYHHPDVKLSDLIAAPGPR